MKILTPDELNKSLLGMHDASAGEACFIEYTRLYTRYQELREVLTEIAKHNNSDCCWTLCLTKYVELAEKALRGE